MIVRIVTSWPHGGITTEEHRWHRHSRREVLEMYRNLWPDDGRFVWDGDTLTRPGTVHSFDSSVEVVAQITFHEA